MMMMSEKKITGLIQSSNKKFQTCNEALMIMIKKKGLATSLIAKNLNNFWHCPVSGVEL